MCFSLSFLAGGERGKIPLIPPAPGSQIYAQRLRLGWAAAVCGRRGRRARRWARRRMVPIASPRFPWLPIGSQRSRPHSAPSARGAAGVWGAPVDPMGLWGASCGWERWVLGCFWCCVDTTPCRVLVLRGGMWGIGEMTPGTHLAPTLPGWLCSSNPSLLAPSAASAQWDPHSSLHLWSWGPEPPPELAQEVLEGGKGGQSPWAEQWGENHGGTRVGTL